MYEPVIVDAVRTPFGKNNGYYRHTRSDALLAHALGGLAGRTGIDPARVDDVQVGCVFQCGEQGANVARLASLLAGWPPEVPAVSLNRWCGSGQQALHFAAQTVAAGDAQFVVAAGVEHLSHVPMFSDVGGLERLNPALAERYELVHQGESGERIAQQFGLSRQMLDNYGMESQRRAAAAAAAHWHRELIETPALDSAGAACLPQRDEGIRTTVDAAKVASLPLAYRPAGQGVLTAANSSQLADAAAAVLVADRQAALAAGLRPKARFRARVAVGSDPTMGLLGVIPATQRALARAGVTIDQLDWIEVNEAFSSVVLAWAQATGADLSRVNPWGGAIAHGHPLGATGPGLLAKLLSGLEHVQGTLGLLAICIGHGQGTATVVERL